MSLTINVQTDLDSFIGIASIVSQNVLLLRLKHVEEYDIKHQLFDFSCFFMIFHVFADAEILKTIFFYIVPKKIKRNQENKTIKCIHIFLFIFYKRFH